MFAQEKALTFGLVLSFVTVLQTSTWAEDEATLSQKALASSYDEYLDPTLPNDISEIPLTLYEGDRYEAEVPDTLDLAEYARESINYLTRLIAPEERDYWIYHLLYMAYNPTIFEFGHAQWKNAFFAESVVLMRVLTPNLPKGVNSA